MLQMPDFARTALRFLTMRRGAIADFPNSPILLASLWIAVSAINVANVVLLPSDTYTPPSGVLHLGGSLILAALVAACAIGRRTDGIRLGIAFMLLGLVMAIVWFGVRLLSLSRESERTCAIGLVLWAAIVVACQLRKGWGQSRSWRGTILASAFFGSIITFSAYTRSFDAYLWSISPQAGSREDDAAQYAPIDHEALWPVQPALVEAAAASLRDERTGGPRTLVLAIAAGGSQQLFGREAKASLALLTGRFKQGASGVLLSNARADLAHVPLATTANLATILEKAGERFDANRDLMIIYLAAHGSRKAELETDLPDFGQLHPVSARALAEALDRAGIKRRIVVVSACYSGTWIPPLASPDTIVMTAAAADRTSFGCDDSREFTVFGEAFIKGSLRRGASLRDAFEDLKRRVAAQEAQQKATPSLPQVYVGAHMQNVWTAKGGALPELQRNQIHSNPPSMPSPPAD